jgi:hypothetical protein
MKKFKTNHQIVEYLKGHDIDFQIISILAIPYKYSTKYIHQTDFEISADRGYIAFNKIYMVSYQTFMFRCNEMIYVEFNYSAGDLYKTLKMVEEDDTNKLSFKEAYDIVTL